MGRLPAQACNRAVVQAHQHHRFEPAPIAGAIGRLAVTNPVSRCLSGAAWLLVGPDDREAAWRKATWSPTAGVCGTRRRPGGWARGVDHLVPMRAPEPFAREVLAFLDQAAPVAPRG
jgi:hypothetical protein